MLAPCWYTNQTAHSTQTELSGHVTRRGMLECDVGSDGVSQTCVCLEYTVGEPTSLAEVFKRGIWGPAAEDEVPIPNCWAGEKCEGLSVEDAS